MPLSKTSWIVRIAYMFTDERLMPTAVDRCTLWRRFLIMLVPWVLTNIFIWVAFGLIFGIIAQPIWRGIVLLFIGQKLVYLPGEVEPTTSVVGVNLLCKLSVPFYKRENISWLDWCVTPNGMRSPIVWLVSVAVFIVLSIEIVMLLPVIYHSLVSGALWAGGFAYGTVGWWGSALLVALAAVLLAHLSKKSYRAFAATPSGAVVVSHFKEWKDKHCTIYELN